MPGGLTIRRKRKESARSQVLVSNFLDSFFLISFWVYTKKKGRSKNAITGTVHWIKKKNWQWTLCPWSSVLNLWPTFLLERCRLKGWMVKSSESWDGCLGRSLTKKRKTSAQNTAQDRDFTINPRVFVSSLFFLLKRKERKKRLWGYRNLYLMVRSLFLFKIK